MIARGRRRLPAFVVGLALVVVAAATGVVLWPPRPSAEDLAEAIYDDGNDGSAGELWLGLLNRDVTRERARCMAQVLVESGVSDEALRALVDHDESYEDDEERQEELQWDVARALADLSNCTASLEDPDRTT